MLQYGYLPRLSCSYSYVNFHYKPDLLLVLICVKSSIYVHQIARKREGKIKCRIRVVQVCMRLADALICISKPHYFVRKNSQDVGVNQAEKAYQSIVYRPMRLRIASNPRVYL